MIAQPAGLLSGKRAIPFVLVMPGVYPTPACFTPFFGRLPGMVVLPCRAAPLLAVGTTLFQWCWTQQQIADTLKVPRRTIRDWLGKTANGISANTANRGRNGDNPTYANGGNSPTLYPCRYEDAIRLWLEMGWSEREIVDHLHLPKSTIHDWLVGNNKAMVVGNNKALSVNTLYCMYCLEGLRRLSHDSVDLVFETLRTITHPHISFDVGVREYS